MAAFAGSMFAGFTEGATRSFGEQGLGGQLYKSIIAAKGRSLLDERDKTSGVGTGGLYDTPKPGSTGAGTPYGTGSTGTSEAPTPGAPYVQEKPAPLPPGMDEFARKGKPIPPASPDFTPPEQQTYEPYPGGKNDPNAPAAAIPTTPNAIQKVLPGFKPPWFATGTPPAAQGAVPAFVPQGVANIISSWGAPPPKPGDVLNGKVFDGVSWKPAPEGGVVPGTTQAIPVPP